MAPQAVGGGNDSL